MLLGNIPERMFPLLKSQATNLKSQTITNVQSVLKNGIGFEIVISVLFGIWFLELTEI